MADFPFPLFPDFQGRLTPEKFEGILRNPRTFEGESRRLSRLLGIPDDLCFRLAFAMYLLGPGTFPPAGGMFADLLLLARRHLSDREQKKGRLLDFVIAYGCGWRRRVSAADAGWNGIWQGALRALLRLAEAAVKSVDCELPAAGIRLNPGEERRTVAHDIAFYLVSPEHGLDLKPGSALVVCACRDATRLGDNTEEIPLGGKCVLSVKGPGARLRIGETSRPVPDGSRVVIACCEDYTEIRLFKGKPFGRLRLEAGEAAVLDPGSSGAGFTVWQCSCGSPRCAERHRIENWKPEFSLRDFVTAAVKGVTPKGIKVPLGFFSLQQGMYYPLLARGVEADAGGLNESLNVRVRLVRAALKQCSCKAGHRHMDAACPKCGRVFDPGRMKTLETKAYLIMEGVAGEDRARLAALGKSFERQAFSRCNNPQGSGTCDNLVPFSFEARLKKEAACHNESCCRPLFSRAEIDFLLKKNWTEPAKLKELRRMRESRIQQGEPCPHCKESIRQIPWSCPYCGACKFAQNLLVLYGRTQNPQASSPVFPLFGDRPEPDDPDDPEPGEGDS
jgi:hypothetical protein